MSGDHVEICDDNTSETASAVRPRLNASTSGRPKDTTVNQDSMSTAHDLNSSTGNSFLTTGIEV